MKLWATRTPLLLGIVVLVAAIALAAPPTSARVGDSEETKADDARDSKGAKKKVDKEEIRARTLDDFQNNGAVPGATVPDVNVVTLDGVSTTLSELWKDKPTLLTTASLTCGRARERQPWVEKLAKKYEGQINVAVLYTLEAHPVIDRSPYAEYSPEYENPARPGERAGKNPREGLARRQPTDLEGRKELAREFMELLEVSVPVVLDEMDNQGWESLGGGPNMGLLIRQDGTVEVKHGWFDGETMDRSIEHFLQSQRDASAGDN